MADGKTLDKIVVPYEGLSYTMEFEAERADAPVKAKCYVWNGTNIVSSQREREVDPSRAGQLIQSWHAWARNAIDEFNERHGVLAEAIRGNLEPRD